MILGLKNWDGIVVDGKKVSIRYDQKQNAFEAVIKKIRAEDGTKKGYLESCGASAFCCIMEGLGVLNEKTYLQFPTGKKIQMDDAIMAYLNDPKNDKKFQTGNRMDNRYAASYPVLAWDLFRVRAVEFEKDNDFNTLANELSLGNGIQALIPGHWIALIAYDETTDEIIYHDSWETRNTEPALKQKGRYERLSRVDVQDYFRGINILYKKVV